MKFDAIIRFDKRASALNEAEVETYAIELLKKSAFGITQRSCRNKFLNTHWPSKSGASRKTRGYPDLLLYEGTSDHLICVWENKNPSESSDDALEEAKFYIEGLRQALPNHPGLPRFSVGYNGVNLRVSVYGNDGKWRPVIVGGSELRDGFIVPSLLTLGINANGVLIAPNGTANAADLRAILPDLRTLYRTVPKLSSGRSPIDFTVALLTLKLVLETEPDWGFWSEQPRLLGGAKSTDHAIAERLTQLAKRILSDSALNARYGDIFLFKESANGEDEKFDFLNVIDSIQKGHQHFEKIFALLDRLPPLHGADFDAFGEVYQALGDEATKKKLGEFFTGRHIISGVLPILFERAGLANSFAVTSKKKMADIACGTGGFLTEMLRLTRNKFNLKEAQVSAFAKKAFYGYDLSSSNASRARVNMYFAGDGFSEIKGGIDALSEPSLKPRSFDVIATNPPYGQYHDGRIEEAFLDRAIEMLKPGIGWGCIVLPTGTIENPRSESVRFNLLRQAKVTDIIALPRHAFAPYTQQRTAIIIFGRRPKPIAAESLDWKSLTAAIGDEEIRFFVVDNDGFANSDKRYRTDLRDKTGAWLHDDLSTCVDVKHIARDSKLYAALINGKSPTKSVDEMGNSLPPKYGSFRVSKIYKDLGARGVPLLPDVLLRGSGAPISVTEWVAQVESLGAVLSGAKEPTGSLREMVEELLATDLLIAGGVSTKSGAKPLYKLFDINKGNQQLTEAAIYKFVVPTGGVPVYGGGAKTPRFRVTTGLLRGNGEPATLFEGPALLLAMDGSSGSVQVIDSGKFYCNHHGAVLKPKEAKFDLWCVAQLIESRLRGLASNQGSSSTLTIPQVKALMVPDPDPSVAKVISKGRQDLAKLAKLLV